MELRRERADVRTSHVEDADVSVVPECSSDELASRVDFFFFLVCRGVVFRFITAVVTG